MTKGTVYLESSVVRHYANRGSRDIVVAAYQEITRTWWEDELPKYDVFISQFVLDEVARGNPEAATARMKAVAGFALLELPDQAMELAERHLAQVSIPRDSRIDAFHISVAVANGMDYIVSWNFHHIANVFVKKQIRRVNDAFGLETPMICTPEELTEGTDGQ
ncbi:MAG: DNA-binding protein [Chitinivibrionales bacterium]|nr:DNA-binding protein [Chitinivibrionales bacterium]